MYKRTYTTILLVFLAILLFSDLSNAQSNNAKMVPIGAEAFEVMRDFFNYDINIPSEVRIVDRLDESEYVREKIVFRGVRDSRVPGYLAIPKNGESPFPCVLLLHGIGSSKEDWWKDDSFTSGGHLTKQLLSSGLAVLALDAEYHGERLLNNDFESPMVFTFQKGWFQRARDMIVQSVIEYRRAIDYLGTRSEIDSSKIGMVGYSMGGMMTFPLTAIELRIKVAVASVTPILKEPYSALAVHHFAPYISGQPFLMLMGSDDRRNYTKEEAQKLNQLIGSDSKELVFYESGHKLPTEWTKKASEWIIQNLQ